MSALTAVACSLDSDCNEKLWAWAYRSAEVNSAFYPPWDSKMRIIYQVE